MGREGEKQVGLGQARLYSNLTVPLNIIFPRVLSRHTPSRNPTGTQSRPVAGRLGPCIQHLKCPWMSCVFSFHSGGRRQPNPFTRQCH